MVLPGVTGGSGNTTFWLEEEEWVFISVFLVPDSKVPIQGAYILQADFEGSSRDLTLRELKEAYPTARTSPVDDVKAWVERSKEISVSATPTA